MATFLDTGVRDLTEFVVYESCYTRCGGFSDVYRGALDERPLVRRTWNIMRWLSPGAKRVAVAVKVIRTSHQMDPLEAEQARRDLMDEITTWSQLEHFNVLPLLGIVRGVHGRTLPSLVSPWCEHGSVFEYIKHPRPAADCISLILQAASAISYLHSCADPIIHGDIKSDNFLLRSGYQVQLSDFGLSKIPRDGIHSRFSRSTDGNIRWMSPELLSWGTGSADNIPTPRSFASDIWALACTFYEILTSSMPYQEVRHDWDVVDRIRQGLMPTKPTNSPSEGLAHLQGTVWPILEKSWTYDPTLRPDIGEVLYDLHQAILTREAGHFHGPVFEFEKGGDCPSVVGNEDPYALEVEADSEPDEGRALALLARSAIGYHCKSDENSAHDIQVRIGWIHISREQFPEAQAHLEVAKKFFEARRDYVSVVTCQRGLAEAAQDLEERIRQYTLALALCSARRWVDQEAFIVRELGNTILAQSELAEGGDKRALISRARLHLTEALSLYVGQANFKLQVQVRCELLLLERKAGNDSAAQAHASAAFQCARETRDRNFAEEACDYLKSTNALSEAMYNAIDFGLHEMMLDTLDRMLKMRVDLPRADSQLDVYFI
ncbi:hypothetical protein FRC08_003569 [Ceratobasidium sp. 394]|nr:hypothetical protein FRC08_003569 [Ceratobasidium sp. 394]